METAEVSYKRDRPAADNDCICPPRRYQIHTVGLYSLGELAELMKKWGKNKKKSNKEFMRTVSAAQSEKSRNGREIRMETTPDNRFLSPGPQVDQAKVESLRCGFYGTRISLIYNRVDRGSFARNRSFSFPDSRVTIPSYAISSVFFVC